MRKKIEKNGYRCVTWGEPGMVRCRTWVLICVLTFGLSHLGDPPDEVTTFFDKLQHLWHFNKIWWRLILHQFELNWTDTWAFWGTSAKSVTPQLSQFLIPADLPKHCFVPQGLVANRQFTPLYDKLQHVYSILQHIYGIVLHTTLVIVVKYRSHVWGRPF